MASSLYKAQYALKLCDIHDGKELHAFCKLCDEKVCSKCIKEDHYSHDWDTITDICREKKQNLPEECKDIRANILPGLQKKLERFERKLQEEDSRFEQNKSILNGFRQRYIDGINKLCNERIDECQQKFETAKQTYEDAHAEFKQKVEFLDMMTTSLDKDITTLPDHDIIDMEKEMREELEKALNYSADKYTYTTVFVPGQMDVKTLKNMVGEMHIMEEKYGIERYSEVIYSVKPVSETKAWIKVRGDRYFKLLERTGEEIKVLKTPALDLASLKNGNIVLSDERKGIISVITQDEKIIRTIDTKPLYPTYISKTENDDILVTLRDDDSAYNLVPSSRRIVQHMALTGKVLYTYEFSEDGKTRLFISPTRTEENKNTDICIINRLNSSIGELIVLHKDGRVKFTYKDDGLKSEKFCPCDIACNAKCDILLTEAHSKAIHMLNAEGIYLCKLCQYEELFPIVISIYSETLWCGLTKGKVKVFRYIN